MRPHSRAEMSALQQAIHQVAEFTKGLRWSIRIVAAYCLLMGFSIIFADLGRFSAEAYEFFRDVPGSPDSWGSMMVIAGMMMVAGINMRHDRITAIGMGLAGLWSGILAVSFLLSAQKYPQANLTAIVVYGKDAVCYLLFAGVLYHYGRYRKEDNEPTLPGHSTGSSS